LAGNIGHAEVPDLSPNATRFLNFPQPFAEEVAAAEAETAKRRSALNFIIRVLGVR
jgi:hypothetical protein